MFHLEASPQLCWIITRNITGYIHEYHLGVYGTEDSNSSKPSNISDEISSNKKLQLKHEWPLSILKLSTFTLVDSNREALHMFNFSIICCTVIKYVLPDPCPSFPNYFCKGSAEDVPSKTYLCETRSRDLHKLTIPLHVWCIAWAVSQVNCLQRFPWPPFICNAISPNCRIVFNLLSQVSCTTACNLLLNLTSTPILLTFNIFDQFATILINVAVCSRPSTFLKPGWLMIPV